MDSKRLGNFGEKIAVDFLKRKGYQILDRNFSLTSGPVKGEIDIVARKDGIITFVEAKTLVGGDGPAAGFFMPEGKVDWRKQMKLSKLGQIWLDKNRFSANLKWQIDIIGVKINPETRRARISHFKNAAGGR